MEDEWDKPLIEALRFEPRKTSWTLLVGVDSFDDEFFVLYLLFYCIFKFVDSLQRI